MPYIARLIIYVLKSAGGVPEVSTLLEQRTDVLRLLIQCWLCADHTGVLLSQSSLFQDLQGTNSISITQALLHTSPSDHF